MEPAASARLSLSGSVSGFFPRRGAFRSALAVAACVVEASPWRHVGSVCLPDVEVCRRLEVPAFLMKTLNFKQLGVESDIGQQLHEFFTVSKAQDELVSEVYFSFRLWNF